MLVASVAAIVRRWKRVTLVRSLVGVRAASTARRTAGSRSHCCMRSRAGFVVPCVMCHVSVPRAVSALVWRVGGLLPPYARPYFFAAFRPAATRLAPAAPSGSICALLRAAFTVVPCLTLSAAFTALPSL